MISACLCVNVWRRRAVLFATHTEARVRLAVILTSAVSLNEDVNTEPPYAPPPPKSHKPRANTALWTAEEPLGLIQSNNSSFIAFQVLRSGLMFSVRPDRKSSRSLWAWRLLALWAFPVYTRSRGVCCSVFNTMIVKHWSLCDCKTRTAF